MHKRRQGGAPFVTWHLTEGPLGVLLNHRYRSFFLRDWQRAEESSQYSSSYSPQELASPYLQEHTRVAPLHFGDLVDDCQVVLRVKL